MCLCACAVCLFAPWLVSAAELQVAHGHIPRAAAGLRPVGTLDSHRRLDLALGLPLRHPETLTNLLAQLYDPSSPKFHHFLSAQQFAEQFGPTEQDYDALIAFARSSHFIVTGTHRNRMLLDVNAASAEIERALHLKLRVYQHPTESRRFYAPDAEPSVASRIPLLSIAGLDDFFIARPASLRSQLAPRGANRKSTTGAQPKLVASGSGPEGTFLGRDFRNAYAPGVALDGSGESVGLVEFDNYYRNDVSDYEDLAGLPHVMLTNVLVSGFNRLPGLNNGEVALDIEMAISMAPGLASVIVYEGTAGNDILNRMATDNLARQLSCSWGFGPQVDPTREQILQQFAAQGQSFFQASGDDGAFGVVSPPADDPLVTSVGGTSLVATRPGGAWVSESAWSFGGGGVSPNYPIPAWQGGISMSANQGSTAMRNVPDVAALADNVIWSIANNGEQGTVAGTSASAPLWAGFVALANQQAAANHQPAVGFVNPSLYAIGQSAAASVCFHDITNGNNTTAASPTRFFAVAGYDLCTGWGTPTGSNLLSALLAPPDALQINPRSDLLFTGPVGGPFGPTSLVYALTNTGSAAVSWTVGAASSWLNASPASGVLSPGGAAVPVTVSLTAAAATLSPGTYAADVWFTNGNDGFVQRRTVTLAVITAPLITTQPTNQSVPAGAVVQFNVATAPNALLAFQWRANGTDLQDGNDISGARSSTLTLFNVTPSDNAVYSVIISNPAGFTNSAAAMLTVTSSLPVFVSQTSYSFAGSADGSRPNGLTRAPDGNLYGTTQAGGANGFGTVFRLGTNGAPQALYSFAGTADGEHPNGDLLPDNGGFVGTTFAGGSNGFGTIFRLNTNNQLSTLFDFDHTNGVLPTAGLMKAADGNFYGTTYEGGILHYGTLFRLGATGGYSVQVPFDSTNGAFPHCQLALGSDGSLYGTTYKGGQFGKGTVFTMRPGGPLTTLAALDGTNGAFPSASVTQADDGSFYGVASSGGTFGLGAVFRVTTAGALSNVYSFGGMSDGSHPLAALRLGSDGNFYGTTSDGGTFGVGTVFRLTPSGVPKTIAQFDGFNGANAEAALVEAADRSFYGATQNGGSNNQGVIFRVSIAASPPQLTSQPSPVTAYVGATAQFTVASFGSAPLYYQWQAKGTNLSDTPNLTGAQGRVLTLSNLTAADSGLYSVLVSNAFGTVPSASARLQVLSSAPLIVSQPTNQTVSPGTSVLLTATVSGNLPLSYQWQVNGTNVLDAGNVSGARTATLVITRAIEANGGSYVLLVTNSLGKASTTNALLTVIPLTVPGTSLSTLYSFAGKADGRQPSELADGRDGFLYGTTALGGTLHLGSIFRVGTNAGFSSVAFFDQTNGAIPKAGLVLGSNATFYGSTTAGGAYGAGTVFSISPTGQLGTVHEFTGQADGGAPQVKLVQGQDGYLYGSCAAGGKIGAGTLFRLDPAGTLAVLYSFSGGSDGAATTGGLISSTSGDLYGLTGGGGVFTNGSVFRLNASGSFATLYSFSGGTDGYVPVGSLVEGDDGAFYGATEYNTIRGFAFYGTLFRITTNGVFNTLYALNFTDGSYPAAGLVLGDDGNFYGTTSQGGANNYGTVFRLAPGGQVSTLVEFDGFNDGANPLTALAQGPDGSLYGTTSAGGSGGFGTLFRLSFTGPPQITGQPLSQTVMTGGTVNFSVAVAGAAPLTYQWQRNGTNLLDNANVSGSSIRVLSLRNLTLADAGTYSVLVTNSLGSVPSTSASLAIVVSPPVLRSAIQSNGLLLVSWNTASNRVYQLQTASSVTSQWNPVGPPLTATGPSLSAALSTAAASQQFYRVVLLP